MLFERLVVLSAGFTAMSAAIALLWRILRSLARVTGLLDHAWEDWAGTEDKPGVIPRLDRAEGKISALEQSRL